MSRVLTTAEIALCDQFEALMASLIEGPVKIAAVTQHRSHVSAIAHDAHQAYIYDSSAGESMAARLQNALNQVYAANHNITEDERRQQEIARLQGELARLTGDAA